MAEPAHTLTNLIGRHVGEVQPHGVRAAVVRMKALSRHERDLHADRIEQQLARVYRARQLRPHEEPARGSREPRIRRKMLLERAEHHVAALLVERLYAFD